MWKAPHNSPQVPFEKCEYVEKEESCSEVQIHIARTLQYISL